MLDEVIINYKYYDSLVDLRYQILESAALSGPTLNTKISWVKSQRKSLFGWQVINDPLQDLSKELGIPIIPQDCTEMHGKERGNIWVVHSYGKYSGVLSPATLQKMYKNELNETHEIVQSAMESWKSYSPVFIRFFNSEAAQNISNVFTESIIKESISRHSVSNIINDDYSLFFHSDAISLEKKGFNIKTFKDEWLCKESVNFRIRGLKPLNSTEEIAALGLSVSLNIFGCLQEKYPNLVIYPRWMNNCDLSAKKAETSFHSHFCVFGRVDADTPLTMLSEW